MANDIITGLRIPSQEPLDVKLYCKNEIRLSNLGTNDNLAYTYYKGLIVYCQENDTYWQWKPSLNVTSTKLLSTDFVYPDELIHNEINYSNIAYNFFKVLQTKDIIIPTQTNYDAINIPTTGVNVYEDEVNNTFRFNTLNSNSLSIVKNEGVITIDLPVLFTGKDYYVNANYTKQEELGTITKPFKSLKRCLDVILNRAYQTKNIINGIVTYTWVETPKPEVNVISGVPTAYNKYDLQMNGSQPEEFRVIIQSYITINENLAINRVTYFLERGGYNSTIEVFDKEYAFDMKELIDNVPKVSGKLPYDINCSLIGKGTIIMGTDSLRKGYIRSYGFSDETINDQPDSYFYLGDINSDINLLMRKKSNLTYVTLTDETGTPIIKDNLTMTGYAQTSSFEYGAIESHNKNKIFGENLFISGNILINYFEQPMIYIDNGSVYGETGRLYIKKSYTDINYSIIQTTPTKEYIASKFHYDIYIKNSGVMNYSGQIYSQENGEFRQGGSEAFVCCENSSTINKKNYISLTGINKINNLAYNHYIKSIVNNSFLGGVGNNNIIFKNTNFNSYIFEEALNFVDEMDRLFLSFTEITLENCYVKNSFKNGTTNDFTNMTINNGINSGDLMILGTAINLFRGILFPSLPRYADNAEAIFAKYPVSGQYIETSTNLIKVVI